MKISAALFYFSFVVACSTPGLAHSCPHGRGNSQCEESPINVRLPPTINPHPESSRSWVASPPGWFYGHWGVTSSSQPLYQPLQNFQYDGSPVFPQSHDLPGQMNDLSSFQLPNTTTVSTLYGIDTPRRSNDKSLGSEWNDVYDFVGTGALSKMNMTWSVLAWGYDSCNNGYMLLYEPPVASSGASAGLDILSRVYSGISLETQTKLLSEIRKLNNKDLSDLVSQIVPLVQNGARDGMPPVVCDVACMNNTGAYSQV
ncbi:hypothetical protein C8Q75DRAFT_276239 [Abortiporus biennis]|nr:hypothetical protein C8Q75DRAFT_276239 [Abortiporus biennis]